MKKRMALLCLSIVILAAFIAYSNPITVIQTISQADFFLVTLAVLLSLLAIIIRGLKWHVLIGGRFATTFIVQNIGITISNFTPGKSGEPAKAVLLKSMNGADVSKSLPTIITERILDLITVVIFALYAILVLSLGDYSFIITAGIGIMGMMVAVLCMLVYSRKFGSLIFSIAGKIPSLRITKEFIDTFYSVKIDKKRIALSFFFTVLVWILEGIMLFITMSALHIDAPGMLVLVSLTSLSIIIAIASVLPGGIGSFEIVLTLFLAALSVSNAASAVLLYRFVSFWFSIFVGGVCFVYVSKRIDFKNIMKQAS